MRPTSAGVKSIGRNPVSSNQPEQALAIAQASSYYARVRRMKHNLRK